MKYLSATETEERFYKAISDVVKGEIIIVIDDKTGEAIARIVPRGKMRGRQKQRIISKLQREAQT